MVEPKAIHFEILGKDQEGLQQFYSRLLGLQLNADTPSGYGMTSPDQTGIVFGIGGAPEGSPGHVTGCVRVADIDATLAHAIQLGGSVIMPKFNAGPDASSPW